MLNPVFWFLLFLTSMQVIIANSQKMSILIPCHYSHFPLLEELLQAYAEQTVIPEEVVISLSQYQEVEIGSIDALEQKTWPFKLIVLKQPKKCAAGTNRKLAAQASSGEILMCQDADDLPHPQRVEIVKYIFENYLVSHLIHSLVPDYGEFEFYDKYSIPLKETSQNILFEGIPELGGTFIPLHHGNVCLSKTILSTISWDDSFMGAEDMRFNFRAWNLVPRRSFVIPYRLILFRTHLSYFSNTPPHLR